MKFVRICLVAGLIPFSLAAHAEMDDAVIKAMADTLAGKPAEAFEALSALEERRAGDPDFDLALGIAANRTKKFSRGIFALERVLLAQPQNGYVHSEVGTRFNHVCLNCAKLG